MVQLPDRRVIACNYAVPSRVAAGGALAYVLWLNPGGGSDRLGLLIRSRGGRWIEKWEDMRRLGDFRLKTIPSQHSLYGRLSRDFSDADLAAIRDACGRMPG